MNAGATAPEWAEPAASGGMTLLETLNASTGNSLTSAAIPSTYRAVYVEYTKISPSANTSDFTLAVSHNGVNFGTAVDIFTDKPATTSQHGYFTVHGIQLASTTRKYVEGADGDGTNAPFAYNLTPGQTAIGPLTHLRFGMNGSNFDGVGATIAIYGVK